MRKALFTIPTTPPGRGSRFLLWSEGRRCEGRDDRRAGLVIVGSFCARSRGCPKARVKGESLPRSGVLITEELTFIQVHRRRVPRTVSSTFERGVEARLRTTMLSNSSIASSATAWASTTPGARHGAPQLYTKARRTTGCVLVLEMGWGHEARCQCANGGRECL